MCQSQEPRPRVGALKLPESTGYYLRDREQVLVCAQSSAWGAELPAAADHYRRRVAALVHVARATRARVFQGADS